MLENNKNTSVLNQIIVAVAIALIAGSTSPWWIEYLLHFFNPIPAEVDLAVRNVTFEPTPPIQNQPVKVNVTLKNLGKADAEKFEVAWWPGENFPSPLIKSVNGLRADAQLNVSFYYSGYKSWYKKLTTKVVIDPDDLLREPKRSNNELFKQISVMKRPITANYELFYNNRRVGFKANWSRSQAVKDCAKKVERYGKQVVKCRFNGRSLGYELFHNNRRVGFEPAWSRSKALSNCAWNVGKYGNQVVKCRFDGQSLKI